MKNTNVEEDVKLGSEFDVLASENRGKMKMPGFGYLCGVRPGFGGKDSIAFQDGVLECD